MSTALTTESNSAWAIAERVVLQGDLSKLSPEERVTYYAEVCKSLGLNPLTRPFEYLTLNGKLVLYARRDCTEQLRRRDKISITKLERELVEGVYVVTAYAQDGNGRVDSSIGAVPIDGLKGEPRAHAYMKAETKAKRRVTLSICGLGLLDESEVDSIPADLPQQQHPKQALPAPADKLKQITLPQREEITALIAATGSDLDRFYQHFRVEGISQLTPEQYAEAKKLLSQRAAKQATASQGNGNDDAPPMTGTNLLHRLKGIEASLVQEGICQRGDLQQYLQEEGARSSLPLSITKWTVAECATAWALLKRKVEDLRDAHDMEQEAEAIRAQG
jgi:hypothetical protein